LILVFDNYRDRLVGGPSPKLEPWKNPEINCKSLFPLLGSCCILPCNLATKSLESIHSAWTGLHVIIVYYGNLFFDGSPLDS